ncbi:hypothetical protein GH714_005133 [Hevea brasiliensis]|uniref:Reverse transcriptase Ty1/copia-type domain-containing protein n=1 Tax=Hevea brasiliensis TaxID=3981 RepID=A0A6A6LVD4_HEVBR|nr:hypothetical protein GH714_005133 [Hevea brasiliensis]
MKKQLSDEFEMKDLGAAKKILVMEIIRDRSVGKLFLSQQAYMNNAKPMTVLFAAHFKLSANMSSKIDKEMEHMSSVPYSSAVGSIIALTGSEMDFEVFEGTTDVVLTFDMAKMSDLVVGYVDSDFTGDLDKRIFDRLFVYSFWMCYQLEGNIASYSCFVYHRG